LATGALIVLRAMWIGRREERRAASQVLESGKA